jgi:transposase-like protein
MSNWNMKTEGFEVKAEDREVLESWLRSKTIPQALGMRARVVLLSAQGSSLRAIAQQLGLTERTVCLWRRRYQQSQIASAVGVRLAASPHMAARPSFDRSQRPISSIALFTSGHAAGTEDEVMLAFR